jgi:hypothetical protein
MTIEATINARVGEVTERIARRSSSRRARYLERIAEAAVAPRRRKLGCANLAHAFAACPPYDKKVMREGPAPSLAIVSAYNDMLSAHQPYQHFPELIREAARAAGGVAQVAGGTPAMCDGITQGEAAMELSLFSRDVIALCYAMEILFGLTPLPAGWKSSWIPLIGWRGRQRKSIFPPRISELAGNSSRSSATVLAAPTVVQASFREQGSEHLCAGPGFRDLRKRRGCGFACAREIKDTSTS